VAPTEIAMSAHAQLAFPNEEAQIRAFFEATKIASSTIGLFAGKL
jgi:hypothetical protein